MGQNGKKEGHVRDTKGNKLTSALRLCLEGTGAVLKCSSEYRDDDVE